MANEDFTTYTESDSLDRLTETASRVTIAGLIATDNQIWLRYDKGVAYFSGDFLPILQYLSFMVFMISGEGVRPLITFFKNGEMASAESGPPKARSRMAVFFIVTMDT